MKPAVTAVIVIGFMLSGCATIPPPATTAHTQAAASARAANDTSDIPTAKQLAADDPLNWRNFNVLGLAYSKAGRYDEAIAAFEQALALHPITTTIEGERKQQAALDAQREAVMGQQKRIQDARDSASLSNLFTSVLGTIATLPGADPQVMTVMPAVSGVLATGDQMQMSAAAVTDIPRTSIESQLIPKQEVAVIYFNLGAAHFKKGNYSQSVRAMDNALALDPSHVDALWWEADAYFRQSNFQKAVILMNRYLALGAASPAPACYTRLSESFRALGLETEADRVFLTAVEEYQRRIAANPGDINPVLGLAQAYADQNRGAEAEKQLSGIRDKLAARWIVFLAGVQLDQYHFAEALQTAQSVLNLKDAGNSVTDAWYLAGRAYDELGSPDEALKAYRKVVELLESQPAGTSMPAYGDVALAAVGRYDEARKDIDSILAKDPLGVGAAGNLFRLALVCEKGGHDTDAIEALNRALSLNRRHSLASLTLRRLEKKEAAACESARAAADAALAQKDYGAAVRSLAEAYQLMAAGPQKQQVLERILRLASEMDNPPPLTPEAQRHYLRGNAALRSAKEPIDLDRAISEFRLAAVHSPWVASIYLNTSAACGVRLRYGEASDALKLYLIASPKAGNVEDLLSKLAELEYQQEENLRSLTSRGSGR